MEAKAVAGSEAEYFEALGQGRFTIQRCRDCERYVFFPRQICPHCGGAALSLVEPMGTGIVYSTTVVRRKPEVGGDINVALIDLDEGVRMMSRVEGIAPDEVSIGMRVKARIALVDQRPVVVFDPSEPS